MEYVVDPGLPEYGSAVEPEALTGEPDSLVDLGVELPLGSWCPLSPEAGTTAASSVLFIDGVQRVDAHIWIRDGVGSRRGVCASFAAGAVRCETSARIECVEVRRVLFAREPLEPIQLRRADRYQKSPIASDEMENVWNEIRRSLHELEVLVVKGLSPAQLTVVDGHLRGREDVPDAVGYVKSHQASYLNPEALAVVPRLEPGQRTPLFLIQGSWSRFSWYQRLPIQAAETSPRVEWGHSWAGVVRCEAATDLQEARRRANLASATLPRFASVAHKDQRAPQNLFPVGGLERELRHRLGDRDLLRRELIRGTASPS